jgi:hypothetical protein
MPPVHGRQVPIDGVPVEEDEAERVRTIFRRCLDFGSIGLLLADLLMDGPLAASPSPEARSPISMGRASSRRSGQNWKGAVWGVHAKSQREVVALAQVPPLPGSPAPVGHRFDNAAGARIEIHESLIV